MDIVPIQRRDVAFFPTEHLAIHARCYGLSFRICLEVAHPGITTWPNFWPFYASIVLMCLEIS
jgi:hypothetical protein